ncbi:uncharacterized protein LOC131820136 isoform X1 [Mustela lutreola]|uniref:Uncharacterized protein LOC123389851 isoform X2 n=1 Tax=Mustela putorius furo TaxID=9669 RepID=A0A8U0RQ46_MUSPF|nr:uncharacterized protein LOC123389851 isoform X2 [Mustela putorius furo]XP_044928557.1 uncharacterized protein LOC123389851 isoform X2 [Mustela putorius furo]XP_059011688.1 uncharacterized protein LOC131820136 isoform X1 [Mustela lutreola]
MDAASSPWNPTPAPISSPSLLLPVPAIVFIAVGIYLLLLGVVLLTRHCLLAQGCCADCSSPCRKQGASRPQDYCWTCAEACDFPLPSPAHCLDACCPQPTEAYLAKMGSCRRYSFIPSATCLFDLTSHLDTPLPATANRPAPVYVDRVGPPAALAAARSVTAPAPASCLTARASTVSALRSRSDEDPESLPLGEWPTPGAPTPRSLTGPPGTFLQAPGTTYGLASSLGCAEPGSQQSRTQRALGHLDCPLEGQEGEGLALWQRTPRAYPPLHVNRYH